MRKTKRPLIVLDLYESHYWVHYRSIVSELKELLDEPSFVLSVQPRHGDQLAPVILEALGLTADNSVIADRRFLWALKKPDVYISAKLEPERVRAKSKIYIGHNLPVKWKFPAKQHLLYFDLFFLTCPAQRDQWEEAIRFYGLKASFDNKLLDVGYPKSDHFALPRDSDQTEGSSRAVKVLNVLYAPTWDPGLSLHEAGMEIVKKLGNLPWVNLAVRLHPGSLATPAHRDKALLTGNIEWKKLLQPILESSGGSWLEDQGASEGFQQVDVLVTDVSSVTHEFVLFGKPIVFYDPTRYFEEVSRDFYRGFQNHYFSPDELANDPAVAGRSNEGPKFETVTELVALLRRCVTNPEEIAIKEHPALIPFNLGEAGRKAAIEIQRRL